MTPSLVIRICWIAFLIYWMVSALRVKRTAERLAAGSRILYRIPLLAGGFFLFRPDLAGPRVSDSPWCAPAGAALCALGLLGAVWARRTLAGNWSGEVTLKQGHELIERGPYRYARHPIYTSMLLMVLGTALLQDKVGSYAAVLLVLAGLWLKLKYEEALLRRHFPAEYPAYQARVKALVPFVL